MKKTFFVGFNNYNGVYIRKDDMEFMRGEFGTLQEALEYIVNYIRGPLYPQTMIELLFDYEFYEKFKDEIQHLQKFLTANVVYGGLLIDPDHIKEISSVDKKH